MSPLKERGRMGSVEDSVKVAQAREQRAIEKEKSRQMRSYSALVEEEREEMGIKYTVFHIPRGLNCTNQELQSIPPFIGANYSDWLVRLDLSYNHISSLAGLSQLKCLEELVLISNSLGDSGFVFEAPMPNLTGLDLNNNQLTDLTVFFSQAVEHLPNISFLSLHGNPICQDSLLVLRDEEEEEYQRYRLTMIYNLPSLKFLDSKPVTRTELAESQRRGNFLSRVVRPDVEMTDASDTIEEVNFRPLPKSEDHVKSNKAVAAPVRYNYKGNHSEGNRFIKDDDL